MTNPTPQGVTLREALEIAWRFAEPAMQREKRSPANSEWMVEAFEKDMDKIRVALAAHPPAPEQASGERPAPMTREFCAAFPGTAAGIINELARQIDAATPTAEPDGVAEQRVVYEVCLAHWGPDNGVTVDAKTVLELLQSHREAMGAKARVTVKGYSELHSKLVVLEEIIAKKDAALKACVDALKNYTAPGQFGGRVPIEHAAITQAEGAMK